MQTKILYLFFLMVTTSAFSAPLSNIKVFKRCYSDLTAQSVLVSPSLQGVLQNQEDAVNACIAILDKCLLTQGANSVLANQNDPECRALLKNMHDVHLSWLGERTLPFIDVNQTYFINREIYSPSSPAAYWTKSLLDPNYNISNVLTSDTHILETRTMQNPNTTLFIEGIRNQIVYNETLEIADRGELLGFRFAPNSMGTIDGTKIPDAPAFVKQQARVNDAVPFYRHFGGGMLGQMVYLIQTVRADFKSYQSDGGVKIPRKWAQSLFRDVLCRELPMVRPEDAAAFVAPNSDIPFRKQLGCTTCHATMDQATGVLKNITYRLVGQFIAWGGGFMEMHPVNPQFVAQKNWPATADENFYRQNPYGKLYFRNYKGELVNIEVQSIQELGEKISEQPDFYICQAKRYFEHFTGLNVKIGDPATLGVLSDKDKILQDLVIKLGLELQTSQNPLLTVKEIIKLDLYKDDVFGIE